MSKSVAEIQKEIDELEAAHTEKMRLLDQETKHAFEDIDRRYQEELAAIEKRYKEGLAQLDRQIEGQIAIAKVGLIISLALSLLAFGYGCFLAGYDFARYQACQRIGICK